MTIGRFLQIPLGHIVAIDSNCGLFGLSHLGDYCASKFAIIGKEMSSIQSISALSPTPSLSGYMECLEDELARSKCTGVNTTSKNLINPLTPQDRRVLVVILGPMKGGLNRRVTEIVM